MSKSVGGAIVLVLVFLLLGWVVFSRKTIKESYFLKEKPLITVPTRGNSVKGKVVDLAGKDSADLAGKKSADLAGKKSAELLSGAVQSFSERDLGIPVMPGGSVVGGSVMRIGPKVTFSIYVPMPLYVVVHFYEQRLGHRGSRGNGAKGEQYVISYVEETSGLKGTRKRTNLVLEEGRDMNATLITVVHMKY
jgi:hypothetical protein